MENMWIFIVALVIVLLFFLYRKNKEKEMPVGIETYDSSGKKTFASDDLTYRILGQFYTGTNNGYITDNNIGGKEVWMTVMYVDSASNTQYLVSPCYSISGNTISWSFPGYDSKWSSLIGRCSHVVSYGVYK